MKFEMKEKDLIEILFDKTAYEGDRHDAAGYLSDFPTKTTLEALVKKANEADEDDSVKGSAGESIGLIMVKLGFFLDKYMKQLHGVAYDEAEAVIEHQKPEWVKQYLDKMKK